MKIKRLIYIPYYLKKTDWKLFFRYCRFVKKNKSFSYFRIVRDVITTMISQNASPLDYFSFRFFDLTREEQLTFPCTGFMYEYQLKMNPIGERKVLHDKIEFLKLFDGFSGRKWATLEMLKANNQFAIDFLSNAGNRLVLKKSTGGAGKEVEVIDMPEGIPDSVITYMDREQYDLAEYYVIQHDELMRMSPSAVNTIRMVTQYTKGEAILLFAFVRISVNAPVDNLSVGHYGVNFGASINLETGEIWQPGIYLDITKPEVYYHPVTGTQIVGFRIPFWNECIEIVLKAAELIPGNKSIGWDVAVTNTGPVLIEGNHNWNLLSMSPGRRGFRYEFLKYASETSN